MLFGKSPEEKVAIVREETLRAPTLFVGDGINDARAMQAATLGVAFGQYSDITAEAADAVVMEPSHQRWMSSFTSAAECGSRRNGVEHDRDADCCRWLSAVRCGRRCAGDYRLYSIQCEKRCRAAMYAPIDGAKRQAEISTTGL